MWRDTHKTVPWTWLEIDPWPEMTLRLLSLSLQRRVKRYTQDSALEMSFVISRVMTRMCVSHHMISWVMSRIGVSFDMISGVIMSVMCRGLCGVYVITCQERCFVYIYRCLSSVCIYISLHAKSGVWCISLCMSRALSCVWQGSCVYCFHMTLQEKREYKRGCWWSRESRTSVSLDMSLSTERTCSTPRVYPACISRV